MHARSLSNPVYTFPSPEEKMCLAQKHCPHDCNQRLPQQHMQTHLRTGLLPDVK